MFWSHESHLGRRKGTLSKQDNIKSFSRRGKNNSIKNVAVSLSPGKRRYSKGDLTFCETSIQTHIIDYNKNSKSVATLSCCNACTLRTNIHTKREVSGDPVTWSWNSPALLSPIRDSLRSLVKWELELLATHRLLWNCKNGTENPILLRNTKTWNWLHTRHVCTCVHVADSTASRATIPYSNLFPHKLCIGCQICTCVSPQTSNYSHWCVPLPEAYWAY